MEGDNCEVQWGNFIKVYFSHLDGAVYLHILIFSIYFQMILIKMYRDVPIDYLAYKSISHSCVNSIFFPIFFSVGALKCPQKITF